MIHFKNAVALLEYLRHGAPATNAARQTAMCLPPGHAGSCIVASSSGEPCRAICASGWDVVEATDPLNLIRLVPA